MFSGTVQCDFLCLKDIAHANAEGLKDALNAVFTEMYNKPNWKVIIFSSSLSQQYMHRPNA